MTRDVSQATARKESLTAPVGSASMPAGSAMGTLTAMMGLTRKAVVSQNIFLCSLCCVVDKPSLESK